jgi:predicted amidophosphoribosyltransferase
MIRFSEIKEALLHLVFPHVCSGCGTDLLHNDTCLCIKCIDNLPRTRFEFFIDNPVEKRFYGRLPLVSATAHYYFTKNSLVSHLVHQVKYKGNRELGIQLGRLMGDSIRSSGRFGADVMIPLPLFGGKERKRGYNQSLLLCEGIASYLPMPVLTNVISRPVHTETQTRKGRVER